jgi:tetratricopeptide (TPR) repeat protein
MEKKHILGCCAGAAVLAGVVIIGGVVMIMFLAGDAPSQSSRSGSRAETDSVIVDPGRQNALPTTAAPEPDFPDVPGNLPRQNPAPDPSRTNALPGTAAPDTQPYGSGDTAASAIPAGGLDALVAQEQRLLALFKKNPADLQVVEDIVAVEDRIADLLLKSGRDTEAMEYMGRALNFKPDDARRWEKLGLTVMKSPAADSKETAAQAFCKALDLNPLLRRSREAVAQLALDCGKTGEAAQHFELLLLDEARDPEWLHLAQLSCLYALNGQIARGKAFFNERIKATGDNRFVLAMSVLMAESGEVEEALKLMDLVSQSEPQGSLLIGYAARLKKKYSAVLPPRGDPRKINEDFLRRFGL